MQWTEPAGSFLWFQSRRGTGSATDRPSVNVPMSWYRRIIVGMVCAMLLAMAAFVAYQVRWYVEFSKRLRLAEQHAPIVRRALEADNRFSELEVESFTGQNGCLSVFAVVEPGSVEALKELVESTSPPVPVKYDLHEKNAAATGPAR